jgi:glycosyltransferase involved in cell wall biosynthesis
MTLRVLLVGPSGHGGEGVYMESLHGAPPPGVEYDLSGDFHHSARGARCALTTEILLNQVAHRAAIPDMGFRALALRERYDLVHVHAHPVWLRGLGDTPLVMSEGSSSAVYLGDYLGWDEDRLRRGFHRARRIYRALRIDDRLLATERAFKVYVFSEWARQVNIRWGADPGKLEVIYPGFSTPPLHDREGRERFTFLFLGSDFERKGGYEVVAAFARVAAEIPEARLVIAGSDPSQPNPDREVHSWVSAATRERIDRQIAELIETGRLVHHRWVGRERLQDDIFPTADAFVMPTYAEGFGFTNVEAMSFGLPVITSRVGPAAEIVTNGESGLLVDPGDVAGLAMAMTGLAADPARARRMGAAARSAFEARFTADRFQASVADLYRRAAAA